MIRIGTSNYRSEAEAKRAYGKGYDDAVKEGRITVGKPPVKDGEKLLVDAQGRYIIETTGK
jgi:hypothetical protein